MARGFAAFSEFISCIMLCRMSLMLLHRVQQYTRFEIHIHKGILVNMLSARVVVRFKLGII